MAEAFESTEELLKSSKTTVRESIIGHKDLPRDFDLGPRSLTDYLFYYVIQGAIHVQLDGFEACCTPYSLLWLPPGTHHHPRCDRHSRDVTNVYHFRFRLQNAKISCRDSEPIFLPNMQDSERLVSMCFEELQSARPDRNDRLRSILYLILSDCRNCEDEPSSGQKRLNRAAYRTVLAYTREHVRDWPTPGELATVVGYSVDYFSRLFKRSYGVTPQRWLVQQRIRAIAEELEARPCTISEIAYEYGYRDICFFSRQFRQVIGTSPSKWRRQS